MLEFKQSLHVIVVGQLGHVMHNISALNYLLGDYSQYFETYAF